MKKSSLYVAIAIIEFHLFEGISQYQVSQSVENSRNEKFHIN